MTGEGTSKEKPIHERDLDSLLKSLRNYIVPGQAGFKKLGHIRTHTGDDMRARINSYLTSKKGRGHAKDEGTGLPVEYSIGGEDLKGNYNHARAIVIEIARSVVAKRITKKAAEDMPEETLLTYLDKFMPKDTNSHFLIKTLAEEHYEDIYKSDLLKAILEKTGEGIAKDIVGQYERPLVDNKDHLSDLERKAKTIHPGAEWKAGLENLDYLNHVIANWTGGAKSATHVEAYKKHFKNARDLKAEYSTE